MNNNDRDMYYGNYGYVSNPFPNGVMPMMQNGMIQNGMIPNGMMPMMQNPNMNYTTPYSNQNMMPCNQNNSNSNSDIDTRLSTIERQLKRLNERITRLEATYNNNTTNIYNEPDSSMYMM